MYVYTHIVSTFAYKIVVIFQSYKFCLLVPGVRYGTPDFTDAMMTVSYVYLYLYMTVMIHYTLICKIVCIQASTLIAL